MYLSKQRILLLALIVILITISVTYTIFWIVNPDPSTIDSDNDGIMDDIDAFPYNPHEQNDTDDDSIGDNEDSFPYDPAASIDSDGDGFPDKWNTGKSQADSTSIPPLTLDDFPYDPSEWEDSDSDGIGDNSDVFPNDPSETRDDDNDGTGNNADHNPFVDLSFSLSINQITLNKHVDFLPWAQVYIKILVNDEEFLTWDNNGSYYYIWKGAAKSISKSFFFDIPESGFQKYTDIEIQVFDQEWIKKDDQLDINQDNDLVSIKLRLYHDSNEIIPDSSVVGNEATITYSITLPEEIEPFNDSIEKTFRWRFKQKLHSITLDIPFQKYEWAIQSTINRSPQTQTFNSKAMAKFVTVNDSVIVSLADKLNNLAITNGYTDLEKVNFVMSFVQQNVYYWDDNASKNQEEYWRFPIETLVDGRGDCEDSSVLFASIIENLDFDAVLLFYIIDDNIGHLATGVSDLIVPDGYFVSYQDKSYYYCETTSIGFTVGEKPNDITEDPEKIIQVE